jgi:NarL family two-component system response regulator LiaR
MNKTRILIADDHPLMREALRAAVEDEPDLEVVGEAADGKEVVALARELDPDVILMDLLMPGMDGLEATVAILARQPEIKILTLTSLSTEDKVVAAVQAGALGYITKEAPRVELLQAIRRLAAGDPVLPPEIALKLFSGIRRTKTVPAEDELAGLLTPRQEEVLALLGEGRSDEEIAETLHISQATVRTHIHHILDRLGLENRTQAVAYANGRICPRSSE